MDAFFLDLRHAARALGQRPAFTVLSVVTLAIGIGINVVAFSAINALVFKPGQIPEPDRTGWIIVRAPGNPYGSMSLPDFRDLRDQATVVESVVAEGRLPVRVEAGNGTEQGWAMLISDGYMELLGARPMRGRLFGGGDAQNGEIPALVSERFWKQRFADDSASGAQTLLVNGATAVIVGVMPEGFQGPGGLYEPEMWLPLERLDALSVSPSLKTREHTWLTVVGRANRGASKADIEGGLSAILANLPRDASAARPSAGWYPAAGGHPQVTGFARVAWIALGVVGIVLLIACFNVASLLLARSSERQGSIDIRAALGATRVRLVRQLVLEGVLLAALAGTAALVLAFWSASLLAAFSLPSPIPQRLHIGVDVRVVLYTGALVLLGGLGPALLPALRATRADLFRSLRVATASPGGRVRSRNGFVIAQVAGSTLFLAAALLCVRSFVNLAAADPGFATGQVLVLDLAPSTYGYDAARSRALFDRFVERLSGTPGIARAALADRVPFYVGFTRTIPIGVGDGDCQAAACPEATIYASGPGHFEALGIPIRSGRDFAAADFGRDDLVVISEWTASAFWPGENALGRTLRLGRDGRRAQVVGIAADITHRNAQELPQAVVYRPMREDDFTGSIAVAVRAARDPAAVAPLVREALSAVDPAFPAILPQSMRQRMEMPLWPVRTLTGLLAICGGLALVLATVGLFGVTYFAVARRTREFGVRLALGATPRTIRGGLALGQGARLSAIGIGIGLMAALVAGRLLAWALFGISTADPLALGAAAALQLAVALAASAVPARRATRTDPLVALRHE